MEGFVLGMDLCDEYCRVSGSRSVDIEPRDVGFAQAEGRAAIQTALGKKRDVNEWLMGKEAYEAALTGEGFVVDKLLSRMAAGESVTVGSETYPASELMTRFLKNVIDFASREYTGRELLKLVISVREMSRELRDGLTDCLDALGLSRDRIHIVSHIESYLYYVLSQKKDYWANESILFDWSGRKVHFYSMNVTRGVRPQVVKVEHQILEEDLSPDNIEDEPRRRVVSRLLAAHAEKLMHRKVISLVLLSGKALEDCQTWKDDSFIRQICNRRKVFVEPNVFARGAAVIGSDDLREHTAYQYVVICEGRLQVDILIEAMQRGGKRSVYLARKGSCWYDVDACEDILLDEAQDLQIRVSASEGKLTRTISIPLENFPRRPPKTTRLAVSLSFVSEKKAAVRVVDKGFGELFPASGAEKECTIMLS